MKKNRRNSIKKKMIVNIYLPNNIGGEGRGLWKFEGAKVQ